jgi:hypothetical protein
MEGLFYWIVHECRLRGRLVRARGDGGPAAPQFHRALIDPVLTAPLLQLCGEIGYAIAMP